MLNYLCEVDRSASDWESDFAYYQELEGRTSVQNFKENEYDKYVVEDISFVRSEERQ